MEIRDLLEGLEIKEIRGSERIEIKGLSKDSRDVREGYLFFLTKRNKVYLDEVRKKGAGAIVTDIGDHVSFPSLIRVNDVEKAMGQIASKFYGEPSKNLFVTGITGTNGKTTTSFLIDSILQTAGKTHGIIGTIVYRYKGHVFKPQNTTPGVIELHRILDDMRRAGTTHVTMEVSSHALDQKRVEGVHFDICVFTNLSHDHLDYHKDFSDYRDAKSLLFKYYLKESSKKRKSAVLNGDDPNVSYLLPEEGIKKYFYGLSGTYDTRLIRYTQTIFGMHIEFSLLGRRMRVNTPLIGDFNIYNILAASLACKIMGIGNDLIKKGIEVFKGVPGRLEKVKNDKGYHVFVDYAHTPDALEKVLKVLLSLKEKRLILVFGCGGDRDRDKRPLMGRIATTLADITIITSDNPRSEDPELIIEDIRKGVIGNNYKIIPDRKEAIYEAIRMMERGDILLIAGKGHEDYQILRDEVIHFSDREVVEEAIGVGL